MFKLTLLVPESFSIIKNSYVSSSSYITNDPVGLEVVNLTMTTNRKGSPLAGGKVDCDTSICPKMPLITRPPREKFPVNPAIDLEFPLINPAFRIYCSETDKEISKGGWSGTSGQLGKANKFFENFSG